MQTHVVYDKPVIIEVRVNEFAPRSDGDLNVPSIPRKERTALSRRA